MSEPIEPTYDSRDLADGLESSVLALLRVPPIRQALHDILRIYGITAQAAEVTRNQNMQMQALAEVMTIVLGRQIEHERRSLRQQAAGEKIIDLLQKITDKRDDPAGLIAKAAAEALALLQAQADAQSEPIEAEAARVRTLLRIAHPTANRADMADAVATAQTLRTAAEPTAPAATDAHALRVEATAAAAAATETAAAAAAQTLRAAAAETAAVDAEEKEA